MDESGELNRLVRAMNEEREAEPGELLATARLDHWLEALVARGGSDLLLVENAPPCVRVQGEGRLDAHAVRMQNPERLVLDFVGTRMAVQRTVIPGVSAPVLEVRLGQLDLQCGHVFLQVLEFCRRAWVA